MATYKVIQDIEAEDKLLGPLSLRQFLYAAIVVGCGFIAFKLFLVAWYMIIPLVFPMILFGILAIPSIGGQQSSEIWLLAKIRYLFLPKIRLWDQQGVVNLVTINVPKVIEPPRTDGLSKLQIKSRLKTLASTLDSRGWAIKNTNISTINEQTNSWSTTSDRLINPMGGITTDAFDIHESDDILDESSANAVASKIQGLMDGHANRYKQIIMNNLEQSRAPKAKDSAEHSEPTVYEAQVIEAGKVKKQQQKLAYVNMKTINPRTTSSTNQQESRLDLRQKAQAEGISTSPVIIQLAKNDDLDIATIARQVNKSSSDEVVISLH